MPTRAIPIVMLLATLLRAADSDFRAGLWEGTMERGAGAERIVLLLTISVHAREGPNAATSAVARVESGSEICGSNQPALEPYRVSFECMAIATSGTAASAGGHFDGHFSPQSNLVMGTWRGQPIQLARPKQTDSAVSEGEWVAESAGQTCVVRFFDGSRGGILGNGGAATIDIYSKERAAFGKQLFWSRGVGNQSARRISFGLIDTDKDMFLGKLNDDNNDLTGVWQGGDFLCGGPNHEVTFRRTPSSL